MDKTCINKNGLEITTVIGCINSCAYCPSKLVVNEYIKRSDNVKLSFDDFKKCINKLPENTTLYFGGFSEPFLNSECIKMILYAYESGCEVEVYTTGIGLTLEDIDIIRNIKFKKFYLHLPDNSGLTRINVNNEYVSLIRKIVNSDIVNIRYICLLPEGYPGSVKSELSALIKELNIPLEFWQPNNRAGNLEIPGLNFVDRIEGVINHKCKHLNRGVLLPNCDVVLCCMDFGLKHVLGNLITSSYASIYSGEEYNKIIMGTTDDSLDILCRYCTYLKE